MYADSTAKPQRVSIRWEHIQEPDDSTDRPDERDEGFWPSLDRKAAGWIGDSPEVSYEDQMEAAKERMAAWERGDWGYIGNIARAHIAVPIGGSSFRLFTIDSAGLWGTESDSDESYHKEIFEDEKAEVLGHLETLGLALASGDFDQC